MDLKLFNEGGLELVIDLQTGKSFATQAGYSRMAKLDESTISRRLTKLQPLHKQDTTFNESLTVKEEESIENALVIRDVELQTSKGLKIVNLITGKWVTKNIVKDNPSLAEEMLEVGWTVFSHQKAGFKIKSMAVQPVSTDNSQIFKLIGDLSSQIGEMREELKTQNVHINLLLPYAETGKVAMVVFNILPNYEALWDDIATTITSNPVQKYGYVSQWTYELGFRDLSRGEMINIGRYVSGFAILGKPEWLPESNQKKGRKKYPEAFKPVIRDITLYVLSQRNTVRLIK